MQIFYLHLFILFTFLFIQLGIIIIFINFIGKMQEDYLKPTNLRDTFFGAIQLPQKSTIQKGKHNIYENTQDDDNFDIGFSNLGQISNIQGKKPTKQQLPRLQPIKQLKNDSSQKIFKAKSQQLTLPTNSQRESSSQRSKQQIKQPTIIKKTQQRKAPQKDIKKSIKQKKQIDLDAEIGQVQQWGQKDDQNQDQSNFDQDDFPQLKSTHIDKNKVQEMRKIAQLKVKQMQDKNYKKNNKPGGLAAKAQQLKRKNEQLQKQPHSQVQKHQSSSNNLVVKSGLIKANQSPAMNKIDPQKSQQQDIWDKVNTQTHKQYIKKQQKKLLQPLTKQKVITFYKEQFKYNQNQIQKDIDQNNVEDIGCWDMFFGCFKDQSQNKLISKMSTRLIAISKIVVSNTDQQFWVFQYIWQTLTRKKFARYGNHWNEIGFQGRDPSTDLRSTGFLSLLQWFQFIDQNATQSKQIYQWSLQVDFPLALTHIKGSGLFLQLIKSGLIKGNDWSQYQKNYNSIVWNTFKKIRNKYNSNQNVGKIVDQNLEDVRRNIKKCLIQYQSHIKIKK